MTILNLPELLLHDTQEQASMPPVIHMEIMHTCNLRCRMCHVSFEGTMSKQKLDIDKVLHELKDVTPGTIILLGGAYEPMSHPGFAKLVTTLSDRGCFIDMTTNGTLFTDKMIDKIKDVNFRHIEISFDGIRKDTYEYIRRRADWDVTTSRVRNFRNAMRNKPVEFQANYVIVHKNLDELVEAMDFWEEMDFHIIHYFMMGYRSSDPILKELTLEGKMEKVYWAFTELAEEVMARPRNIRVRAQPFSFPQLKEKYGDGKIEALGSAEVKYLQAFRLSNEYYPGLSEKCNAAYALASIWYDGNVALCNRIRVGNINQEGGLLAAFNSPAAQNLRRGLKLNSKNCKICDFFQSCVRNVEDDDFKDDIHHRNGPLLDPIPRVLEEDKYSYYVKWMYDYYSVPKGHDRILSDLGPSDAVRYSNYKKVGILSATSLDDIKLMRAEQLKEDSPVTESQLFGPYIPSWAVMPHMDCAADLVLSQSENIQRTATKGMNYILVIGDDLAASGFPISETLAPTSQAISFHFVNEETLPEHFILDERDAVIQKNIAILTSKTHIDAEYRNGKILETLEGYTDDFFDFIYIGPGYRSEHISAILDLAKGKLKQGGHMVGGQNNNIQGLLENVESSKYAYITEDNLETFPAMSEALLQNFKASIGKLYSFWGTEKIGPTKFKPMSLEGAGKSLLKSNLHNYRNPFSSAMVSRVLTEKELASVGRIFIYGTGEYGKLTHLALNKLTNKEPTYFVHTPRAGRCNGIKVLSFVNFIKEFNATDGDLVIIASHSWREIANSLKNANIDNFCVNWSLQGLLPVYVNRW